MVVKRGIRPSLDDVRARRAELGDAIQELGRALSAPAPDRQKEWLTTTRAAVDGLFRSFQVHLELAEGRDGLLDQIVDDAPRLSNQVSRIRRDHVTLATDIERLAATVKWPDASIPQIRQDALQLISALSRHRHEGADLIFEAYQVDLGGSSD